MLPMMLVVMVVSQGPTIPLAGTVVDPDGKPVAGAELVLTSPKPGETPVVARGKSGEGGRFRLDRPAAMAATNRYLVPTLWAIAPGRHAAVMKFAGAMPADGESVRVILGPPAKTEFRVESPEGEPVAGARLSIQKVMPDWSSVPDAVAEHAERATGPDGAAVLETFRHEEISFVDVIAKGYGIQPRRLDPDLPGLFRITLKPVAKVSGRLVPDQVDPKLLKGWRVRAWTRDPALTPGVDTQAGYASATTDDDGRFVFLELAPGLLNLAVIPPRESDLLADLGTVPAVRQDRQNVLEIPIRRSATITGLVREQETGKPVAGMRIVLFSPGQSSGINGATDAEGRYSFQSLAGKARVWASETPSGYTARHFNRDVVVPAGPARVEVAALELTRAAPTLRGTARDEAGRPVAGAQITAEWVVSVDGKNEGFAARTTTDALGAFAIDGLPPAARVKITARHHDLATVNAVDADAGSPGPIAVVLVGRPVIAVAGRVVDPGGVPLAGAVVTIRVRETTPNGRRFALPVQLEDNHRIKTGPDGTFRTPRELDRPDREYQAEVTAAGYHPARTPFLSARPGDEVVTLPDLSVRKLQAIHTVAGRVLDRDGRPVAGASISQAGDGPMRTETTSDHNGQFRLTGVFAGRALVFAEKTGFRFGGAIAGRDGLPVAITLVRDSEPPIARLKTLLSPMPRADERALARELLEPLLPPARVGELGASRPGVITALAWIDPNRVLTMLENRVIADPAPAIVAVALGQFENDPPAAIATIEASLDARERVLGLLALADAVPAADRTRRDEFLDHAFAAATRAPAAGTKLWAFKEIADRWLDAGDIVHATPVLRAGRAVVATMQTQYRDFGAERFGEVLAVIDLPAARALIEAKGRMTPPDARWIGQHLGEAAVHLAPFNPAEAERLASEVVGTNIGDREWVRFRVARRMSRADLARARKLLLTVAEQPDNATFARPQLVPYGFGLMASDLALTDAVKARGLLDQAFAGLKMVERAGGRRAGPPTSTLMAALLPVVERVDPDRLAERLWLAASCRPPRPHEPHLFGLLSDAALALMVSRYDRAIAAAIAAPVVESLPAALDQTNDFVVQDGRVFEVLAAYDPHAISRLISMLPVAARRAERFDSGERSIAPDALARLAAGKMLGMPIAARRRAAIKASDAATSELPDE